MAERKTPWGAEKKNQKECTGLIYEVKEVHYALEEAQTKTKTHLGHGLQRGSWGNSFTTARSVISAGNST